MINTKKGQIPQMFDRLFKVLSSDRFINREGLGGNKPIFIQPYDIGHQIEVDEHISSLIKRLDAAGILILSVDLYELYLQILNNSGTLEKILEGEQGMSKREFKRGLQGSTNTKQSIIPFFQRKMKDTDHKIVFVFGIDKVHPLISIVPILSEVQTILDTAPFVFFYPGIYDNFSLNLFGCISETNEYRARNLDNYS